MQEAVAYLAASNHAPNPPEISSGTKPSNVKIVSTTNVSKFNKPLMATSILPTRPSPQNYKDNSTIQNKPPNQKESSWALVTHNGHKKARGMAPAISLSTTRNINSQARPNIRSSIPKKDASEKKNFVENKEDNRILFVSLCQNMFLTGNLTRFIFGVKRLNIGIIISLNILRSYLFGYVTEFIEWRFD